MVLQAQQSNAGPGDAAGDSKAAAELADRDQTIAKLREQLKAGGGGGGPGVEAQVVELQEELEVALVPCEGLSI